MPDATRPRTRTPSRTCTNTGTRTIIERVDSESVNPHASGRPVQEETTLTLVGFMLMTAPQAHARR